MKKFFIFIFVIAIIAMLVKGLDGENEKTSEPQGTVPAVNGLNVPATQQKLMDLLAAQETAYFGTTQHEEREALATEQEQALCNEIGYDIKDWVGTIESLKTVSGKSGAVEIKVSDKLTLMTWSGSVADGQDDSLIAPNSDLFKALTGLKAGDNVRFSGRIAPDRTRCYRYANLSSRGRKKEPKLIVLFSEIKPL